jgi:adenylosuccinate lyase
MISLVEKGMGRQVAHEVVRRASMGADERDVHLLETLKDDEEVTLLISEKELEKVMNPENYIGKAPEIVDRAVAKAELLLSLKI